jgi:4-hydroxy-tetrahydrodipicolinate synthase
MTEPRFIGVYPILPTPFNDDEVLDTEAFAGIIRFMVDVGVDGVTILGVLGEANRMVDAERSKLIETAVATADGRIPIIVGTSHSGTQATIELSHIAHKLGAAGVMVTPHREPTPNTQRIYDHFARIADAIELPIILQDHPISTQVHMPLDLVLRMVAEIDRVSCIKQEAVPSPARVAALVAGMTTRKLPILTGLGALYGGYELARGADGFMTGFAFPEVLMAMVIAAQNDDHNRVMDIYTRYLPLIVFEGQPGVAIRKDIFRQRGLMASSQVRHPGGNIDDGSRSQLESTLARTFGNQDITQPITVE